MNNKSLMILVVVLLFAGQWQCGEAIRTNSVVTRKDKVDPRHCDTFFHTRNVSGKKVMPVWNDYYRRSLCQVWCLSTIDVTMRLCYCRGTARRATSVDILWPFLTELLSRSSANPEEPCELHCQLKSCKMLHKCSTDCMWKRLQPVNDLQGHSRSLPLPPFDRPYTISY